MFLEDAGLMKWAENGGITPFNPKNINATSIDLEWSGRYRLPKRCDDWRDRNPLDFRVMSSEPMERWEEVRHADYLLMEPNAFYLLDTLEYIIMPEGYAGILFLKSTWGRAGAEHLHAGLFEPKFQGTGTLEVCNMHPMPATLCLGDRFVQLALVKTEAIPSLVPYDKVGRYSGQNSPQPSRPSRG